MIILCYSLTGSKVEEMIRSRATWIEAPTSICHHIIVSNPHLLFLFCGQNNRIWKLEYFCAQDDNFNEFSPTKLFLPKNCCLGQKFLVTKILVHHKFALCKNNILNFCYNFIEENCMEILIAIALLPRPIMKSVLIKLQNFSLARLWLADPFCMHW